MKNADIKIVPTIIVLVLCLLFASAKQVYAENNVIFEAHYYNYSWGYSESGLIIFEDGRVLGFDNHKEEGLNLFSKMSYIVSNYLNAKDNYILELVQKGISNASLSIINRDYSKAVDLMLQNADKLKEIDEYKKYDTRLYDAGGTFFYFVDGGHKYLLFQTGNPLVVPLDEETRELVFDISDDLGLDIREWAQTMENFEQSKKN